MFVFVLLVVIMMEGRTGPKGPSPTLPEVPARVEMLIGKGPRVTLAFPGTQVAVDVPIRAVRGAVRDVIRARATESFIADVSGGTGAAVAGGAVRNGGNGAGRNGGSEEVEEQ